MSQISKQKHKKWVEEKERNGSLKKPITCKGKKEHDFVLLVPFYIHRLKVLSPQDTLRYYELEERVRQFHVQIAMEYQAIGVKQYARMSNPYYFYKCSVCGKETSKDKLIK
jgi:hypothetical protein